MDTGLIYLYTGDGAGKSSAAFGHIFRALGHNWKICMIQFVKSVRSTGEKKTAEKFSGLLEFHVKGKGFTYSSKDKDKHIKAAREAWEFAKEKISSDAYNLIILDELTYLIKYNIIGEDDIISALKNKPQRLHIIITGRDAGNGLIEAADLVSDIKNVKHPYDTGVKAQKGIEY